MAGRRELKFDRLDEVMPDVERLLAGHETVGSWSLGQICRHLALALVLTTRSGSRPGGGPRVADAPELRETRRRFFESGRFPEGVPVPSAKLDPPADLDAHAEAETLRKALARFASAPGPFGDHPMLGPLSAEEWARFHGLHCAHHLSFALPTGALEGFRGTPRESLPPRPGLN